MFELPEGVPKRPVQVAAGLLLLGFLCIIFAGGSLLIISIGTLLVLAGGAIGFKLGLDLWKATE